MTLLLFPALRGPLYTESVRPFNSGTGTGLRGPVGVNLVASLPELVAYHHPLDLGGPLPDPVDPELPEQPLHRLLSHVPAASVDLHGSVDHPPGGLGAHELHGRGPRVELLAVDPASGRLPPDPVEHRLRGHDLGGHVREHELDRLEVDDRPTELRPSLGEVEREVEGAGRRADRPGADHDAFLDEPFLRELVSLPHFAEDPVV